MLTRELFKLLSPPLKMLHKRLLPLIIIIAQKPLANASFTAYFY